MAALQAEAAGLRLGYPAYGGTGCPNGTASVSLSPDETELSILFDQYSTEAGGVTGKMIDRKSCNISVPVAVPQGYSVAIFQVDYRGFIAVPAGGLSDFTAEYFWAGSRGPTVRRTFYGPQNQNFTLGDKLIASTLVWSACGDSVNLRVNTSLRTQTNRNYEQAIGMVDSADISSGVVYHLQWRRCN
jgi:hypothetical protein